jgi:hypothetical protein
MEGIYKLNYWKINGCGELKKTEDVRKKSNLNQRCFLWRSVLTFRPILASVCVGLSKNGHSWIETGTDKTMASLYAAASPLYLPNR